MDRSGAAMRKSAIALIALIAVFVLAGTGLLVWEGASHWQYAQEQVFTLVDGYALGDGEMVLLVREKTVTRVPPVTGDERADIKGVCHWVVFIAGQRRSHVRIPCTSGNSRLLDPETVVEQSSGELRMFSAETGEILAVATGLGGGLCDLRGFSGVRAYVGSGWLNQEHRRRGHGDYVSLGEDVETMADLWEQFVGVGFHREWNLMHASRTGGRWVLSLRFLNRLAMAYDGAVVHEQEVSAGTDVLVPYWTLSQGPGGAPRQKFLSFPGDGQVLSTIDQMELVSNGAVMLGESSEKDGLLPER